MEIDIIDNGPLETNCYICSDAKEAIVIDPNFRIEPILDGLQNLELKAILLTHAHIDHISALNELKNQYPKVPVYTHMDEKIYLTDPSYNLSTLFGETYQYFGEVELFEDDMNFSILGQNMKIFHTPGHTMGSLSYYFPQENLVFAGDVLFKNSVGRTDFKGGNPMALIHSIKTKLYTLPADTLVYPGHGQTTIVQYEIDHNPFTK